MTSLPEVFLKKEVKYLEMINDHRQQTHMGYASRPTLLRHTFSLGTLSTLGVEPFEINKNNFHVADRMIITGHEGFLDSSSSSCCKTGVIGFCVP